MTCKDCINYDWCKDQTNNPDYYDGISDVENRCKGFKDKSQYIKLPCKVGDTVYFIKSIFSFMATPKPEKIRKIEITADVMTIRTENRAFNPKAINDIVFLTKESAEKALRERENNG